MTATDDRKTTDLVKFLTARLDEDEAQVRESESYTGAGCAWPGLHLDPPRALRDVEAKRKILDSYVEVRALAEAQLASNSRESWMMSAAHPVLRSVLETFAAVYSDHPDYRQDWA